MRREVLTCACGGLNMCMRCVVLLTYWDEGVIASVTELDVASVRELDVKAVQGQEHVGGRHVIRHPHAILNLKEFNSVRMDTCGASESCKWTASRAGTRADTTYLGVLEPNAWVPGLTIRIAAFGKRMPQASRIYPTCRLNGSRTCRYRACR